MVNPSHFIDPGPSTGNASQPGPDRSESRYQAIRVTPSHPPPMQSESLRVTKATRSDPSRPGPDCFRSAGHPGQSVECVFPSQSPSRFESIFESRRAAPASSSVPAPSPGRAALSESISESIFESISESISKSISALISESISESRRKKVQAGPTRPSRIDPSQWYQLGY